MTRWNLRRTDQRILAKQKLAKFYSSYGAHLDGFLAFADREMRGRLADIENLFAADLDIRGLEAKRRRFEIPLSYGAYVELRERSRWLKFRNRELRRALDRVEALHQRQWFRNGEILSMALDCLRAYRLALSRNHYLRTLCRLDGYVGLQSKMFRRRRLEEAKILIKEFKGNLKGLGKGMCINSIEDHMRMLSDFLVQCRFKLDKYKSGIDAFLSEVNGEKLKKMSNISTEDEVLELELPGWSMASN